MIRDWKSMLGGAAVAALLIVPTLAHGEPATPPAPPAPPAPSAPRGPQASAQMEVGAAVADARSEAEQARAQASQARAEAEKARAQARMQFADADDGTWATKPRQTFSAHNVHFDSVIGSIRVDVRDGGPMTLDVSGTKRAVDGLSAHVEDGTLQIEGSNDESFSVWDWTKWFDFSDIKHSHHYKLNLHLTVPRGSDVSVDDFVGDAVIGDTMGNLDFAANATKTKIGKVKSAKIELEGSGQVDMSQVQGPLHIEIDGSGRVNAGDVGSVHAELNGSGDAALGNIRGPLHLEIAGSGSLTATRLTGPLKVEIAGAGSVKVADGVADPFHVEIAGSGDVFFGGLAVDPHIEAFGSGKVRIHAIRGKLNSEGMANVKVGD